jgi:hypothetical protein
MARLDPERTKRAADVTGADGGDLQRRSGCVLRARHAGREREQGWNAYDSTENISAVTLGSRNFGHFRLLACIETKRGEIGNLPPRRIDRMALAEHKPADPNRLFHFPVIARAKIKAGFNRTIRAV